MLQPGALALMIPSFSPLESQHAWHAVLIGRRSRRCLLTFSFRSASLTGRETVLGGGGGTEVSAIVTCGTVG